MLSRRYRLSKKENFKFIYKKGFTRTSQFFYLKALKNSLGHPRLAVVVGLKISQKAHQRNYFKRLIRASLREFLEKFLGRKSYDLIIILKKAPAEPDQAMIIRKDLERCLKSLS